MLEVHRTLFTRCISIFDDSTKCQTLVITFRNASEVRWILPGLNPLMPLEGPFLLKKCVSR